MTTTDHAIVAPAVTGDPGTRADASGFDPGRAYATRDGRKVLGLRPMPISGFIGKVGGEEYQWWASGRYVSGKTHPLDLVNVGVRPAAPDPIPQPEGDAPPAPAQSAGAADDDESFVYRWARARAFSQYTSDPDIFYRMISLAEEAIARRGATAGAAADDHASPEALHAFAAFVWRQRDEIDAGAAQDEAERLGLLTKVPYDPEKHGESDAESGEEIFCLKPLAGSCGAAADGEDDAAFVERIESRLSKLGVKANRDRIFSLARRGARSHEPAFASARSARGEDDAAEYPYVTQEHLEEIVATWHPVTDLHRVASELLHLRRRGAQPIEPVPHWHSDFDAAPKTGKCVLLRRGLSYVPYVGHWTLEHGWVRHDGRNPPEHQPTDWCPLPGDSERNAPHKPAAAAPTASASRDPEDDAWAWMHKRFTNVEAGQDPNDRDYGADDMVDAFIAGAARRATSAPTQDAVLDRARPAGQGEGEPVAWQFKDYTGEWITMMGPTAKSRADEYVLDTGCAIRALYITPPSAAAAPPAPASREDGLGGADLAEALSASILRHKIKGDVPNDVLLLMKAARNHLSRATSAPAQDAGPADDCPLCDGQDLECPVCAADETRKTAARARTPDAGKETGR